MKVQHPLRQHLHALLHEPAQAIRRTVFLGASLVALGLPAAALAGDTISATTSTDSSEHYGLFGWLDHRSVYGKGAFPEPFLVDDSDLEVNEARFDWLHTSAGSSHGNLFTGEIEKGFGPLTLEVEVPFEHDNSAGQVTRATDNVDLGARVPFWQYVSADGFLDTTFGVAIEVGIPTHSSLSRDTEYVPKVFNDTKLGNVTLQTIVGYSMLRGPGEDGGLDTFEYGFTLGYSISHKALPIPTLQELVPIFELSGETPLNHDESGRSSIQATLGVRANMNAIGRIQPRIGIGAVIPLNNGGRDDNHAGLVVSMVFEY